MATENEKRGRTKAIRCNGIREVLAIAALIAAGVAFAETSSPEPALEAKPQMSALSEATVERAKALAAYSEALAVAAAAWGSPLVTMYC